MKRPAIVLLLLGLLIPSAQALERFSYCGELLLVEEMPMPMPMAPGPLYLGPLGITPMAPRSCTYVLLGQPQDGRYWPTLVVWSDVPPPMTYHADIYSDRERIWGHRQHTPSAGDPARNREMEAYLDAAAGTPVLEAVLAAMAAGHQETTLEREVPVPMPFGGGPAMPMKVRYRLFEFQRDGRLPTAVRQLIEEARQQRSPHTPHWQPITLPAARVPR